MAPLFRDSTPSRKLLAFGLMALLTACGKGDSGSTSSQNPSNEAPSFNFPTSLADSIQDVRFTTQSNNFQFQVQYSDPSHVESANDVGTVSFNNSSVVVGSHFEERDVGQVQMNLVSSNPDFTGSVLCSVKDCSSGTFTFSYNGTTRNSLSGSVNINYKQSQLLTFTKILSNGALSNSASETAILNLIASNRLRSGLLEQYKIPGGRINPFYLTLYYGALTNLIWHGTGQGANIPITINEVQNGNQLAS